MTTAKLSTVATLNATGFHAGLAKMQVGLSAFSAMSAGAFAKIGMSILNMAKEAVTSLPRMTLAGLEMGHALEISSKMTGVAASRLAVYHRAARLAGMGAEEFDTSLSRLNAKIGEAIHGDKKLSDILGNVGFDLNTIADSTPDETFLALAEAISKTKSAYERAYIARAAFGRGGLRMLPLLSEGRAGMTNLAASTQRLGAAPTEAQVEAMGRAKNALEDLTTVVDGLKYALAIKFAPAIERAAKETTDWAEGNSQLKADQDFADRFRKMDRLGSSQIPAEKPGMPGEPGYLFGPPFRGTKRQIATEAALERGRVKSAARLSATEAAQEAAYARRDARAAQRFGTKGPVPWVHKQSNYSRRIHGRTQAEWDAIRSDREAASLGPGLTSYPEHDGQYRDRLGRTLHDVIATDIHGPPPPNGMPFGWNYQGFPSEADKKGNILGELESINLEGNWSVEQVQESVAALKKIADKVGGMSP